jgi:hypothetical protein
MSKNTHENSQRVEQLDLFYPSIWASSTVFSLRPQCAIVLDDEEREFLETVHLFADSSHQTWSVSRPINARSPVLRITLVQTFYEFLNDDHYFLLMADGTVRYKAIERTESNQVETSLMRATLKGQNDAHLVARLANKLCNGANLASNRDIKSALREMKSRGRKRIALFANTTTKLECLRARHESLKLAENQTVRDWISFHRRLLNLKVLKAACKRTMFSMAAYNELTRATVGSYEKIAESLRQNYALATASLYAVNEPKPSRKFCPDWAWQITAALRSIDDAQVFKIAHNLIPARKSTLSYIQKYTYAELGPRAVDRLVAYLEAIAFPHWPPSYRVSVALVIAQEARTFEVMLAGFTRRDENNKKKLMDAHIEGLRANAKELARNRWALPQDAKKKIGSIGQLYENVDPTRASSAQHFLQVLDENGLCFDSIFVVLLNLCKLSPLNRCELFVRVIESAAKPAVVGYLRQLTAQGTISPRRLIKFLQVALPSFYDQDLDSAPQLRLPTPYKEGYFDLGEARYFVRPATTFAEVRALGHEFENCLRKDAQFVDIAMLDVSIWVVREVYPIALANESMVDYSSISLVSLRLTGTAEDGLSIEQGRAGRYVLQQVLGIKNRDVDANHKAVANKLLNAINGNVGTLGRFWVLKQVIQEKLYQTVAQHVFDTMQRRLIKLLQKSKVY